MPIIDSAGRPFADSLEVRAPAVMATALRVALRLPAPIRGRVLNDGFDRAQRAFNRGDLSAVFALFTDDAEYVPPPALHAGPPIIGRVEVQQFWEDVFRRFEANTITNLSIEQVRPGRFVRTARLTHRGPQGNLDYSIRQTTELRRGRVVRQVNEQLPEPGAGG